MSRQIIKITSGALTKLKTIANDNNCKNIIFSVKGGGCSGFKYQLEPSNEKPNKLDEVIDLRSNDNSSLESLIVCNHSLMHLLGTKIDWKKDIMGETFVFENPMAQNSCGCGTSFNSKGLK